MKTYEGKTLQKYYRVHFMLASYFLATSMPWAMVIIPSETPLKKLFYFANGSPLQKTNLLSWDAISIFPSQRQDPICLERMQVLCILPQTLSSFDHWFLLTLKICLSLIPYRLLIPEGRGIIRTSHLELRIWKPLMRWTWSSCGSLCYFPCAMEEASLIMTEQVTDLSK